MRIETDSGRDHLVSIPGILSDHIATRVDDETSFTKAWTAEIPLNKTTGPIFEYACHEGNYAMSGGLGGARVEEKKAAEEAATKGSR